jgi:hypothetical protein
VSKENEPILAGGLAPERRRHAMTVEAEGVSKAHRELDTRTAQLLLAAERFPKMTTFERAESRRRILRSLREEIEPLTRLDELPLYPDVVERLGDPLVTASLNYDYIAIRHWIELIAAADLTDTAGLQRLLYGLEALIRVHRWKEDELFLAFLDSSPSPALAG